MHKDTPDGPSRPHTLTMEGRMRAQIAGVEDVDSFNEEMIVLITSAGGMTLSGAGLHISELNLEHGMIKIDGRITALEYDDRKQGGAGVFGRLFK